MEDKMFKGTKAKIKNTINIYALFLESSKFEDLLLKQPQEESEIVL